MSRGCVVKAPTGAEAVARSRPREGDRQRALSRLASWVALVVLFAAFVAPAAGAGAEQRSEPQLPPVVVEVHDDGFHWADAAVGAAAAIGFVCVAGVAVLMRRAASA
jgi:hypothetical protein